MSDHTSNHRLQYQLIPDSQENCFRVQIFDVAPGNYLPGTTKSTVTLRYYKEMLSSVETEFQTRTPADMENITSLMRKVWRIADHDKHWTLDLPHLRRALEEKGIQVVYDGRASAYTPIGELPGPDYKLYFDVRPDEQYCTYNVVARDDAEARAMIMQRAAADNRTGFLESWIISGKQVRPGYDSKYPTVHGWNEHSE